MTSADTVIESTREADVAKVAAGSQALQEALRGRNLSIDRMPSVEEAQHLQHILQENEFPPMSPANVEAKILYNISKSPTSAGESHRNTPMAQIATAMEADLLLPELTLDSMASPPSTVQREDTGVTSVTSESSTVVGSNARKSHVIEIVGSAARPSEEVRAPSSRPSESLSTAAVASLPRRAVPDWIELQTDTCRNFASTRLGAKVALMMLLRKMRDYGHKRVRYREVDDGLTLLYRALDDESQMLAELYDLSSADGGTSPSDMAIDSKTSASGTNFGFLLEEPGSSAEFPQYVATVAKLQSEKLKSYKSEAVAASTSRKPTKPSKKQHDIAVILFAITNLQDATLQWKRAVMKACSYAGEEESSECSSPSPRVGKSGGGGESPSNLSKAVGCSPGMTSRSKSTMAQAVKGRSRSDDVAKPKRGRICFQKLMHFLDESIAVLEALHWKKLGLMPKT